MCKKYVNASVRCFKSITLDGDKIVSYDVPFVQIRLDTDTSEISISNFYLVTTIDFLGTNNESHKKENMLESKKKLDFIIRLTKCSPDENQRIGCDLDTFSIDLNDMYEKRQVNQACFGFFNYTRNTKVDKLKLPGGSGKYVIKVLIKDADEKDYTIQSMSQLLVI